MWPTYLREEGGWIGMGCWYMVVGGGGGGGGVGDFMWQGRDCCGWGWDFLGGVLHRMVLWEGKKGGGLQYGSSRGDWDV